MFRFNLLLLLMICVSSLARGQQSQYLSAQDSDPEATKVLEGMERRINGFEVLEATFTMKFSYPEEDEFITSGRYFQQGKNVRIETEGYMTYSDGETLWTHDLEGNEVMVTNASTQEYLTIANLLSIYKDEEFVYRLSDSGAGNAAVIEFKPLDKTSEHSKITLIVDSSTFEPQVLEVLEKDGSRIVLAIEEIRSGQVRAASWYHFNTSEHPGVHVEDLRID